MEVNSENIRKWREEYGLTQQELANHLGVSLRTVTNYEKGGKIPKAKTRMIWNLFNRKNKPFAESVNDFYDDLGVSSTPPQSFSESESVYHKKSINIDTIEDRLNIIIQSVESILNELAELKKIKN